MSYSVKLAVLMMLACVGCVSATKTEMEKADQEKVDVGIAEPHATETPVHKNIFATCREECAKSAESNSSIKAMQNCVTKCLKKHKAAFIKALTAVLAEQEEVDGGIAKPHAVVEPVDRKALATCLEECAKSAGSNSSKEDKNNCLTKCLINRKAAFIEAVAAVLADCREECAKSAKSIPSKEDMKTCILKCAMKNRRGFIHAVAEAKDDCDSCLPFCMDEAGAFEDNFKPDQVKVFVESCVSRQCPSCEKEFYYKN